MKSCAACGRPPSDVCAPCLTGNPPPEKLEADRAERERETAEEHERKHAQRIRQTQQALTDIPELQALADLFVLPGTGVEVEGYSASHPESKPPVNVDLVDLRDRRTKPDSDPNRQDAALDLMPHRWRDGQGRMVETPGVRREGVVETLASWVRLVDGELWDDDTPHQPPPTRSESTVLSEAGFLLEHHAWISEQPWFPEFATDLVGIHRDLARTCHLPVRATRYTCTDCGWDVQAMDNGTWFSCTGCKRAWTEIELHRMAERRRPKSLPECASLAGVGVSTLREAVAKRQLRPVAREGNTHLFDLDDVMPIAARIKLGRVSGRRKVQA